MGRIGQPFILYILSIPVNLFCRDATRSLTLAVLT